MNIKFDIPENYFEDLPDKMIRRIEFEERKSARKRTVFTKILTYGAAAVICLGVFIENLQKQNVLTNENAFSGDYENEYAADIVQTINDAAVLYYTSPESDNTKHDLSDIADSYPSPITMYDNYGY